MGAPDILPSIAAIGQGQPTAGANSDILPSIAAIGTQINEPTQNTASGANTGLIGGTRNFAISALPGYGIPLMAATQAVKNTVGDVFNGMPLSNVPSDLSSTYGQAKDIYQANRQQYQTQHPIASTLQQVGGNTVGVLPILMGGEAALAPTIGKAASFIPDALQASRAARIGGLALKGAAEGGATNAIASGDYNQPFLDQVVEGAGVGAILGPGAPLAAKGIGAFGRMAATPFRSSESAATNALNKFAGSTPAIFNASEIVPGSIPTLAEATGNPGIAGAQRTMKDINPAPFVEREKQNAAARNNLFAQTAKTPDDIAEAMAEREAVTGPRRRAAFANAGEANPAYVNRAINRILNGPAGQRDAVVSALKNVQNKLFLDNPLSDRISRSVGPINDQLAAGEMSPERTADFAEARRLLISAQRGNTSEDDLISGLTALAKKQKIVGPIDNALGVIKEGDTKFQTDAAQLYGIRQDITDSLSPLAGADKSGNRLAAKELGVIKNGIDSAIEKAAPGFGDYLKTYSQMSRPIDQMRLLQGLNLTDATGNITLAKVQNALRNISKQQAARGVNQAKSLTPEQINALTAIRDDLLREQNLKLGKPAGSDTFQRAINGAALGRAGLYAGHFAPWAGTFIGAALGSHFGVGPELGGVGGLALGKIAENAMASRSANVQKNLIDMMLNPGRAATIPTSNFPVLRSAGRYLANGIGSMTVPSAALGVNRLLSSPAQPAQ